jgi:hypothetical protein
METLAARRLLDPAGYGTATAVYRIEPTLTLNIGDRYRPCDCHAQDCCD